jgi:acyl-CoA thioesterase
MSETDIARRCAAAMFANDKASQDLGISVTVKQAGCAEAVFEVRDNMLNGHDVCHGGYIFTLADTAFAFACNSYDRLTLAASASIEFLRPARAGEKLSAIATESHRGGRSGLYDVVVSNQDGERVALFRGRSHATSQPILDRSDT